MYSRERDSTNLQFELKRPSQDCHHSFEFSSALFFLLSIDFWTEIKLWISKKPCNRLRLVRWKVCVLQNIILWCFGNCFDRTNGLIKLNREDSWKFLPHVLFLENTIYVRLIAYRICIMVINSRYGSDYS